MKLKELNEGIDTTEMRKRFRDTLEQNKGVLQNVKTTIGMTRVLRKLFPDVNFKFTKRNNTRGQYSFQDNKVIVFNAQKILSPKTVRERWWYFVKNLTDTLTHEHVHKEQGVRGGIKYDKILRSRAPIKLRQRIKLFKNFEVQMADLKDTHDEAIQRGYEDIATATQKKMNRLISVANRQGIALQGNFKNYLEDPLEVTAFAEDVAETLVDFYTRSGAENVRQAALNELKRSVGEVMSSSLEDYRSTFNSSDKVMKRFYKQVVRYINQKTE